MWGSNLQTAKKLIFSRDKRRRDRLTGTGPKNQKAATSTFEATEETEELSEGLWCKMGHDHHQLKLNSDKREEVIFECSGR